MTLALGMVVVTIASELCPFMPIVFVMKDRSRLSVYGMLGLAPFNQYGFKELLILVP